MIGIVRPSEQREYLGMPWEAAFRGPAGPLAGGRRPALGPAARPPVSTLAQTVGETAAAAAGLLLRAGETTVVGPAGRRRRPECQVFGSGGATGVVLPQFGGTGSWNEKE